MFGILACVIMVAVGVPTAFVSRGCAVTDQMELIACKYASIPNLAEGVPCLTAFYISIMRLISTNNYVKGTNNDGDIMVVTACNGIALSSC
jgi:hypothetical protein